MNFRYTLAFSAMLLLIIILLSVSQAQDQKVRASLKAGVMQRLGADTDITIEYSRPGVKGRVIWGGLVPYGLMSITTKDSLKKDIPWRAGANENTTIEFNHDLLIEDRKLPAGKYGVHIIPYENEWIIIFSKKNAEWGSYTYDEKEDALRVKVIPVEAPFQNWLTYGFDDLAGTSATLYLWWEKLKAPVKIELAGSDAPPAKPAKVKFVE
ncbi:MAG: DUF2911 domain-containing protein [Calditrichaceae bacterium]|nr:DUF2911 domain-containing protein [Calditrichaceae bacterium]MBN2707673.1 DUF2911 domain-containing protein [Calditrichaceae bacterium]RQV97795.1 MAG: DUF2911 domain-containing protein [Calditrichota bacterium]